MYSNDALQHNKGNITLAHLSASLPFLSKVINAHHTRGGCRFISERRGDELEIHISKQQFSTVLTISSRFISGPCHPAYSQNLVGILPSLCTTGSSDRHHTLTDVKRDYHISSNFLLHSASNLRHWQNR